MRAALYLAALLLIAAAPAPPSPAPPTKAEVAKGLFGGREPEPGDEEEAGGATEPPSVSPSASPSAASTGAYDTRVRQSYAAAESFRGRLDGAWTLSARGGDLMRFQLTDKGDGRVEGAWRDLRRPGALDASGFVDDVTLAGPKLDLKFKPQGQSDIHIDLQAAADGGWAGKLWRADEVFDVVLRRAP